MKKTLIRISCSGKEEVRKLLHGFADDKHWWEGSGDTPSFTEDDEGMRLRLPLSSCVSAVMTSDPPYKTAYLKFSTSGTFDGFEEVSLMGILLVNFKTKRPEMRCIDVDFVKKSEILESDNSEVSEPGTDPIKETNAPSREGTQDPLKKTTIPQYIIGDPDPSYLHDITCMDRTPVSGTGHMNPMLAKLHNDFSLKQIYKDEYDIDEDLPKSGDMYSHYDSEVGGSFHGC